MSAPRFDFRLGADVSCFTLATCDRVGLSLVWLAGPSLSATMMPDQARAMANALYEAADAAEKEPLGAVAKVAA